MPVYTIELTTLLAIGANIFLGLAIPVALYVVLRGKLECENRALVAGCSTMIAVGLVVDLLISALIMPTLMGEYLYSHPWANALFLGLVAALIREPGRYLCIKLFLPDELWDERNALMFGNGFGGTAMIGSVIVSALGNFLLLRVVVTGQATDYLTNLSPENAEVAKAALDTLCSTPALHYLMITVDQFLSLVANTAFTVLVWFAIQGGKASRKYMLMAMGLHLAMEAVMVMLEAYLPDVIILRVLQLLLTGGVVYLALQVWKKEYKPLEE